jgi:SAM-dependent methyltransferase
LTNKRLIPDKKRCPACDNIDKKLLLHAHNLDIMRDRNFEIVQCAGCGLVSTLFEGTDKELGEFYRDEYYAKPKSLFNRMKTVFIKALKVKKIEFHISHGRILDIGCGDGRFLSALNSKRWDKYCVETEEAPDHTKSDIKTCYNDLQNCKFADRFFDVITLWAVFEHIRDPRRALVEINRILKDTGLLFISVPNISSFQARVFKDRWFALDPPRHLFHYDIDTISRLLNKCGFTVLKREKFSFEYSPFLFVQSLLNVVGHECNALYHFIKGVKKFNRSLLYDLLFITIFGFPVLIFSLLESMTANGGGQINIYAKKNV